MTAYTSMYDKIKELEAANRQLEEENHNLKVRLACAQELINEACKAAHDIVGNLEQGRGNVQAILRFDYDNHDV